MERTLREGNEEGEKRETAYLAMDTEPQILSGEKRGPLGTGSEPLKEKLDRIVAQELGLNPEEIRNQMDVDVADTSDVQTTAKEVAAQVKEGKRQTDTFRRSVDRKKGLEMVRSGPSGWQSAAFDI